MALDRCSTTFLCSAAGSCLAVFSSYAAASFSQRISTLQANAPISSRRSVIGMGVARSSSARPRMEAPTVPKGRANDQAPADRPRQRETPEKHQPYKVTEAR